MSKSSKKSPVSSPAPVVAPVEPALPTDAVAAAKAALEAAKAELKAARARAAEERRTKRAAKLPTHTVRSQAALQAITEVIAGLSADDRTIVSAHLFGALKEAHRKATAKPKPYALDQVVEVVQAENPKYNGLKGRVKRIGRTRAVVHILGGGVAYCWISNIRAAA